MAGTSLCCLIKLKRRFHDRNESVPQTTPVGESEYSASTSLKLSQLALQLMFVHAPEANLNGVGNHFKRWDLRIVFLSS